MAASCVSASQVQAFLAAYDHVFALLTAGELQAPVQHGETAGISYEEWFEALPPHHQALVERLVPEHRDVVRAMNEGEGAGACPPFSSDPPRVPSVTSPES